MSTVDELETAFKKALKTLDGEKRAAIKKAKGTKGKKAKDAVTAVEEEYASKLNKLQEDHQKQIAQLSGGAQSPDTPDNTPSQPKANAEETTTQEDKAEDGMSAKDRKQEKARRKKQKQKEREEERQREIEEETANAGPSLRQVELEQIQKILAPINLSIAEVEADGNCLYRAVGAQTGQNFGAIRALCADMLKSNEEEFSPFCEYTDDITGFDQYVDRVRNSAEWGGHLELRALGMALDRPIHVYSVQSGTEPLKIHESDNAPIRLSYHLHYYALGEHYNQVVESG